MFRIFFLKLFFYINVESSLLIIIKKNIVIRMHVSQQALYQSLRDSDYSLSPNNMNCIICAPKV